jgi:preprotein translocase subunit SecG
MPAGGLSVAVGSEATGVWGTVQAVSATNMIRIVIILFIFFFLYC